MVSWSWNCRWSRPEKRVAPPRNHHVAWCHEQIFRILRATSTMKNYWGRAVYRVSFSSIKARAFHLRNASSISSDQHQYQQASWPSNHQLIAFQPSNQQQWLINKTSTTTQVAAWAMSAPNASPWTLTATNSSRKRRPLSSPTRTVGMIGMAPSGPGAKPTNRKPSRSSRTRTKAAVIRILRQRFQPIQPLKSLSRALNLQVWHCRPAQTAQSLLFLLSGA